jgi:hypothetical protein
MCATSPFLVLKEAYETSYVFSRCSGGDSRSRIVFVRTDFFSGKYDCVFLVPGSAL